MNDTDKSRMQIEEELAALRQKVAQFEALQDRYEHVQSQIENSEKQCRLLYENIALSYQSLDADGRLLAANQAWLGMLGVSESEVIGHPFGDFLTAASRKRFQQAFPQLKHTGYVPRIEFEMVRQDGTHITIMLNGRVEYDVQGNFQRTHCILTDITEHKEMEASLRQMERIINQSGIVVFLWRAEAHWPVELVSENIRRFGYTPEALQTQQIMFSQLIHPDDLERVAAEVSHYSEVGVDEFDQEYRIVTKSGEVKYVYDHTSVRRDGNGRITHYQGIVQDITERKKAQQELRQSNRKLSLLNRAQQALNASLDLDMVLATALDETRTLLGAVAGSIWLTDSITEELVCRQVTEPHSGIVRGWRLQPGQGIAGWVAQNGQSLSVPDAQIDDRHFRGVDRKTDLTTHALLCVPLKVKDQVIGVIQVMDTESHSFQGSDLALLESFAAAAATAIENAQLHKRLAKHAAEMEQRVVERTRELVAANKQLKDLDNLKTKLIEDISHELRTPVANLSLYLDLLERGKPDRQAHYKAVLRQKMNELVRLTEDILHVFRLDLFQGNITLVPLDMNELIAEAVNRQKTRLPGTVSLQFEPQANLPLIQAERKQVQQVVTNLLNNAINYTSDGVIRVGVYCEAKQNRVCFYVEDTGMGIAPEERPFIFDRFYRGRQVGQLNIPGTGLGLAVVKDIISLHGGGISVDSEVGRGSRFDVWLPVDGRQ